MRADQLNEFNKEDYEENEAVNLHSENALELVKEFGTPEEVEAMQRIMDQHMRRGHILPHEVEERNALSSKYYSMLEHSVNPTLRSTLEGYKVMPAMDSKYVARKGLEGPFTTLSGKVVYYDPKEGKYYDPDTDIYLSYDEFRQYDNDYSGIGDEEADDFVKDIEPKETNEWVQDSPAQGFSGQERNFIQELCLRMDGVSKSPEGLKWMGKSKTWDEGNVLSDKGKLTTVMLWAKRNLDDLYDRMGSEFKVYSDGNDKGESGRGQSDGNQIIQNIINKVGKIGEETVKGPRGHLSSIVADDVSEINNNIKEAGGYYTQPIYDMIKQHGYPKVMHELLTSLDADVIQDFISRADIEETSTISTRQNFNTSDKGGVQKSNYTSHTRDFDSKKGLSTLTTAQQQDGSTSSRFVMPGGSGVATKNGVERNIQMKGPRSWAYDKPKLNASKKPKMKKEGKYVSDAQRKAVHASKAEKK